MPDIPPITLTYDGAGRFSAPTKWWQDFGDRYYTRGERYNLVPHNARSRASHNHYFAALHEAWQNLPTEWALLFPTAEHLRKYALVKTGWCNIQAFAMAAPKEAHELQKVLKAYDEFSVVTARENVVTKATAMSQSEKAMGKDDFAKSKDDVLAVISAMIGTDVKTLTSNAGNSADGQR
jgi:hypothetical protein